MTVPSDPIDVVKRLERNEEALRFILSLIHPGPINVADTTPVASFEAWHQALMGWLELYGGRIIPPEPEEAQ